MIAKLIRHDIKKMTRILVYMYVICVALACITRLINIGKDIQIINIIGQVFAGCTYAAIANILINTFVHIIRTFIVNFYKDESYLTHTLPVTKSQLLLSKYLSALTVILSSVAVCVFSLFVMLYTKELMELLRLSLSTVVIGLNMSPGAFVTLMVFVLFAQICAMMSYAFTAIVQANRYNSNRTVKGLLWFVAFYFAGMISTLIIAVIVLAISGNISQLIAEQMSGFAFNSILIIGLITYASYAIIFYFICQKLFNKGVNVD